jgi:PIN domain nuclease of toxin-antitoxin system
MAEVVLDASVVLAAILREPGHEAVLALRETALVSAVNVAEARSRLADHGFDRASIDASMGLVDMRVVEFDAEQAALSSDLRPATRAAGLSLGDRACLALAQQKGAMALTADRAWTDVDVAVDIRMVR